jgi:hypothetical protein
MSSDGDIEQVTSRSNKMFNPRSKFAFNQCYQRALAQINFSPASVKLAKKTFFYWERLDGRKKS